MAILTHTSLTAEHRERIAHVYKQQLIDLYIPLSLEKDINTDLRAVLDNEARVHQQVQNSWQVSSRLRNGFSNNERAYWEALRDFVLLAVAQQNFQIAETLQQADFERLNAVVSRVIGAEFRYGEQLTQQVADKPVQQPTAQPKQQKPQPKAASQSQQQPKKPVISESTQAKQQVKKQSVQQQASKPSAVQPKQPAQKQSAQQQDKPSVKQSAQQQSRQQPSQLGTFVSKLLVTADSPYDVYPQDKATRSVALIDKALSDAALKKAVTQLEALGYTDTKKLSFGVLVTMLCLNFVDDGSLTGVVLSDDDKALLNVIADSKPVNFDVLMDKLNQLEHAVDCKNKNMSVMRSEMDTLLQVTHTIVYLLASLVGDRFGFHFVNKGVDADSFDPTRDVIVRFVDTLNTRVAHMLSSRKQRAGRMR